MKLILATLLFCIFSIQALACSGNEMRKLSEKTLKKELGTSYLKSVESDFPARSNQSNTYLISAVALDKNNTKHVMYFRYEMNTGNLKCDLIDKTEIQEVTHEGGCARSEMIKAFKIVLKADKVISEIRDFRYHEPQRTKSRNDTIIMAASSIDDYDDLRQVYLEFLDFGDSCKLTDYTAPIYN